MAQAYTPFGLRPVRHPSGLIRAERYIYQNTGTTPVNPCSAANIYQYDPVYIDGTTGFVQPSPLGATSVACGTFMGVEWSDPDGRRRVSNQWIPTSVQGGGDVWMWITTDPNIEYLVQVNGSLGGTLAIGSLLGVDRTVTPNAVVGFSTAGATTAAGTTFQVANLEPIIPLSIPTVNNPAYNGNNAWTDVAPIIQVKLASPQFQANTPGF